MNKIMEDKMSHKKKCNLLKIIIIVSLALFLLQACSKEDDDEIVDTGVCTHPWLLVGFDATSIGTTIGDIEIWKDEGRVQIGLESFDRIAKEFVFYDMKNYYSANSFPKYFYGVYGVYPLNVFAIGMFDNAILGVPNFELVKKALLNEPFVLYVDDVSCIKSYCRETVSNFKPR